MKFGVQSLHTHTYISDGKLSHQQVLDISQKYGLSLIAFTDHDILPDEETIKQLFKLNHQTKWLIGIELSAGLPKELGDGSNGPHLLGLFVDPTNKKLLEHCQKALEERLNRVKVMVKNLKGLGFDITEKECLDNARGGSVGQPHVVAALTAKEKNVKLIGEYINKMKKDAESDLRINKLYQQMIQRGEYQYPYVLFLNSDSYIPEIRVPYLYWRDFDQSVALIRDAGGVVSIAHYTHSKKDLPFEILEKLLKEDRVDGVEVVYGLWESGSGVQTEIEEDIFKIKELLLRYNKIPTGGVDAHKEEDFQLFMENKNFYEKTQGLTENIIDKFKVSLKWSNIEL